MLRASTGPMPETWASSSGLAVLASTPTALTHEATTSSRARRRAAWSTSCWYWPTPSERGSIFTSSASGSISRRPMDTAPRTVRSWSGNSRRATSDAEYTEAPVSFTSTTSTPAGRPAPRTKASVSRPAVPLPTATTSMLYFMQQSRRVRAARSAPASPVSG
ncbi:hypothetical protein DSECCO2_630820 [anaerobic digester metagenome]